MFFSSGTSESILKNIGYGAFDETPRKQLRGQKKVLVRSSSNFTNFVFPLLLWMITIAAVKETITKYLNRRKKNWLKRCHDVGANY